MLCHRPGAAQDAKTVLAAGGAAIRATVAKNVLISVRSEMKPGGIRKGSEVNSIISIMYLGLYP